MPILAGTPIGFTQPNGWSVVLGGLRVDGSESEELGIPEDPTFCALPDVTGCLVEPPDGLGIPDLRTQDVSYLGRDGVKHHDDWYEPRIITLQVAIGGAGCGCDEHTSVRRAVRDLTQQWGRSCNSERELVIYPPNCSCDGTRTDVDDLDRPLGIRGRPRQAVLSYTRNGTAALTLRFDAENHLMYLLDCCGNPGSNEQCQIITPTIDISCRQYSRCYNVDACGWSYDVVTSTVGGTADFLGGGTECVGPTVTLYGPLTNPTVESVTTSQTVTYSGAIPAGSSVVVDLSNGTAMEGVVDRTGRLDGDLIMLVQPGANSWRLQALSADDTGHGEICWRPAVIVA